LIRDFEQEIPGYLQNEHLARVLESTTLRSGDQEVGDNLRRCYERLIEEKIFPADELRLVNAWLADIRKIQEHSPGYSA